jgi:apolipoprotein N-acyltransferase
MATLRGVESGFTVIRAARNGLLSVTDRYGRVIGEAPSASAPVARLVAAAPLGPGRPTVYARVGDVFGWLCVGWALAAWGWRRRGPRSRGDR